MKKQNEIRGGTKAITLTAIPFNVGKGEVVRVTQVKGKMATVMAGNNEWNYLVSELQPWKK